MAIVLIIFDLRKNFATVIITCLRFYVAVTETIGDDLENSIEFKYLLCHKMGIS